MTWNVRFVNVYWNSIKTYEITKMVKSVITFLMTLSGAAHADKSGGRLYPVSVFRPVSVKSSKKNDRVPN